ncbi:hypothetical protein [Mesorhizobium sp. Root157]|uniref:hypothetical protein n=1 Tax=Mesorhizobium sp. Root157 TaxID=1736477 RepID=UPI000AA20286|nr:hypothetical protein [Mesorhizobium sp. Root157]
MKLQIAGALVATLLLAGCNDVFGTMSDASSSQCFSIISGNSTQPYSPIMLNRCKGEAWLLVRSPKGDKPEDDFTYNWYKMDRFDWPASLVSK